MKGKNSLPIFLGVIIIIIVIVSIGLFWPKKVTSPQTSQNTFITIKNSGSTNFRGYTLTIRYDGSGEIRNVKAKTFPAHTFDISAAASQILNSVGDVSQIGHTCIKSVSFGSVTTLTFNNKTSGDISCIDSNDLQSYQQLKQQIEVYVAKASR